MDNSQLLLRIYEDQQETTEIDRAIQKFAWALTGCKDGEPSAVASCVQMLKTLELLEADDPHLKKDLGSLKNMLVEALGQASKERVEAGSKHHDHEHHDHDPESEKNLERYRRAGELLAADANRPKAQFGPAGGKSKVHIGPGKRTRGFRRRKRTRGFPKNLWPAIFFVLVLPVLAVLIVYAILYVAVRIGFGG